MRRAAAGLALGLSACAAPSPAPVAVEPSAAPTPVPQVAAIGGLDAPGAAAALARLNAARAALGLPAAAHDPELSRLAALHAEYLRLNVPDRRGSTHDPHAQVEGLPGWTAEGAAAARTTDVAWRGDVAAAVGSWLGTLHHRLPLVEPRLTKVGLASARGATSPIHVMTFQAGGPRVTRPVACPGDGETGVPVGFTPSGEEPDPVPGGALAGAGWPITVQFPAAVSDVRLRLLGPDGAALAGHFSDPSRPATTAPQGLVACLIPAEPLAPATAYRVEAEARLGGRAWRGAWGFTTEAVVELAAADRAALLAAQGRLTRVRGTVGTAVATPFWQLLVAETPGLGAWLQVQPPAQARFVQAGWGNLQAQVGRRFQATGTIDVDEDQIGIVLRRPTDLLWLD